MFSLTLCACVRVRVRLFFSVSWKPQSQNQGGNGPLEERHQAIIMKEAAEAEFKEESTSLMLVLHGINISKVLFNAMCEWMENGHD